VPYRSAHHLLLQDEQLPDCQPVFMLSLVVLYEACFELGYDVKVHHK